MSLACRLDFKHHLLFPAKGSNGEPCRSLHGGYCISERAHLCPMAAFATDQCPGPADFKCCLTMPFDERKCVWEGGVGARCQDTAKPCANGAYRDELCPSQPADIKCCVPNSAG